MRGCTVPRSAVSRSRSTEPSWTLRGFSGTPHRVHHRGWVCGGLPCPLTTKGTGLHWQALALLGVADDSWWCRGERCAQGASAPHVLCPGCAWLGCVCQHRVPSCTCWGCSCWCRVSGCARHCVCTGNACVRSPRVMLCCTVHPGVFWPAVPRQALCVGTVWLAVACGTFRCSAAVQHPAGTGKGTLSPATSNTGRATGAAADALAHRSPGCRLCRQRSPLVVLSRGAWPGQGGPGTPWRHCQPPAPSWHCHRDPAPV